jgi:predicted RNA-binding protein with PIN domain
VPEPTLYLFDGHNLLHAGAFADLTDLKDELASFVALRGAQGIVVFDGAGRDEDLGPLKVRYAKHADALLERLASERRGHERIILVSSDVLVRNTAGQQVGKLSSRAFLAELAPADHREYGRFEVGDRLDDATRAELDRRRRQRD